MQRILLDVTILISEKQTVKRGTSNLKLVWNSEVCWYRMTYRVKMKLFNLYSDWILQWGFADTRQVVNCDYPVSF